MDLIIYLIVILLIVGISLLSKNYIKKNTIEAFGGSIHSITGNANPEDIEEEKEELNLKPKLDSDKYEIVGSVPPPSYKDAIYDYNLKYAKKIWEEMGCDPQSKYAPNIHNKDDLFDSTHGWSREDYKFRVKSLNVEANKAEYNYYDWGKYKDKDKNPINENNQTQLADTSKNLWEMNKSKVGSNWKSVINRPEIVRYPMGMRKAKTLCFGKDPGDYVLPKNGDKVKIRQKVNYNSPYFAGIVITETPPANEKEPIEVLWYQKGTATIDPRSNKIMNYFNNEKCDIKNLASDEDGCTRNLTDGVPPEVTIDVNERNTNNSIGWKLYGVVGDGNGQQDWFGWPNVSPDNVGSTGKKWMDRYLKDVKNIPPAKLKNYDSSAKLKTINDEGKIDTRAVFKIKECQENSACEDLRCSTIVEKIKKQYPLTNVCKVEKKNTVAKTEGQYCKSGTNKGAIFTYYTPENLCSFQDYGGTKDSDKHPKTFCKQYCGTKCEDYTNTKKKTTSYYAEVWSKPDYKGHKAIVRGVDGVMDSEKLFPEERGARIKSMKVRGSISAAMLSNSTNALTQFPEHNDNMIPLLTGDYSKFGQPKTPHRWTFDDEVKNTYVKGNNIDSFGGLNEMECKDACISTSGCASIDYVKKRGGVCWLNNIRLSDKRAKNLRGTHPDDTYYEVKDIGNSMSFRYIEICKFHIINGCPTCRVYVPTNAGSSDYFENVSIPNLKIKYLSVHGLYYGDQNWGNVTTCNIRGYYGGDGSEGSGDTALNAVITYNNKKGNRGNGGFKDRGSSNYNNNPKDAYGKSYNKFQKIRAANQWVRNNIDNHKCDLFMDLVFGDINRYYSCSEQEARHKKRMEHWIRNLEIGDAAAFDNINTSPNPNPDRLYKVSGTKKVNRIKFYPSKIGSGHASVYLGFGNMKIYETLT
jgi:hypothetical protein